MNRLIRSIAAGVSLGWLALTIGGARAADVEKTKPDKPANAKSAAKQKGQFGKRADEFRKNFGSQQEAKLPANVESIPPKKLPGRTNLSWTSGGNLGKPITAEEIDEMVVAELEKAGIAKSGKRISDDRFVRRVFIDTIGQLPGPADIEEYVNNPAPDKKAKLIDRLLDMPQYGQNWGRFWRDVVVYRATASRNRLFPFDAETWLTDQLNKNTSWGAIVSAMLTAEGLSTEIPQGFFVAAHEGKPEELAGEASRIFLGIQISCAQCHDHPTDTWKRDQFHELAAFFGGAQVRPRRDLSMQQGMGPVVEIAARFRRQPYRKPDLKDPSSQGEVVTPAFLAGQQLPQGMSDKQSRSAVATFITSKKNPYFAKAFVNRMWAELMGVGFVDPVDDLGRNRTVTYPKVFAAVSHSFASSNYDIKRLMRTLLNTRIYDRDYQEQEGSSGSAAFRNVIPTRLTADQIFDAVDWVLGNIDDGRSGLSGPRARFQGPRAQFREVFGFDPSATHDSLEGSIPQALVLMNNPALHGRISANRDGTLLSKLLKTQSNDRDIVKMLYLRVLARKPTTSETELCLSYLKDVGNRSEAFEDVLWGLLNSTEFLNNH